MPGICELMRGLCKHCFLILQKSLLINIIIKKDTANCSHLKDGALSIKQYAKIIRQVGKSANNILTPHGNTPQSKQRSGSVNFLQIFKSSPSSLFLASTLLKSCRVAPSSVNFLSNQILPPPSPAKTHQSTFCCYFVCLCMLAV